MSRASDLPSRWRIWTPVVLVGLLAVLFTSVAAAQPRQVATAALAGAAEPTVGVIEHPIRGPVLTDAAGMTLYVLIGDQDNGNVSICFDEDGCTIAWPPVLVEGTPVAPAEVTGELGVQARPDSTWQLTYNGRPLYYYIEDFRPGDFTGDRVVDIYGDWRAVPVPR